tara:strand:- start:75982 stop:76923 length:942 start_codon:yes stop_codon:yes gene_type:complete
MKQFTIDILRLTTLFLTLLFTSCNNDDDKGMDLPTPMIENVEIGLGNNGIGTIGRDFHLDMDITAGNLVHSVQVQILQQSDRDYPREWSFEIIWDEYKGMKNTNVHKHFDIPEDAVQGIYDFKITILDENGTNLEEIAKVELIDPADLPVDPQLYMLMVEKVDNGYFHIMGREDFIPDDPYFHNGEKINSYIEINNIKDDGIMYILLIKKSLGHRPETVEDIDFSKVIVCDVHQHIAIVATTSFSNFYFPDSEETPIRRELMIGATQDNHLPTPNAIIAEKEWESGTYYYVVIYKNTTHNIDLQYYFEFEVEM